MSSVAKFAAATGMVLACVSTAQAVEMELVTVGSPGNAGEWSGEGAGGYGPDRICGAVDYVYNIGTFEVTAGQYTEFLNAVADEDTFGLYNANMWNSEYGCKIERTGSWPNFSYSVAPDWAGRPVNYVSWGDAARFCNWLHNGQPEGVQDLTTTEDGSYYLNGATSYDRLMAVGRDPDATWVIPSEDEWYKAAYHYNDGATSNYYDYPPSTDELLNNGNPEGDTGNSANFYDGDYTIGSPYYRTRAGFFGLSESPYNTFDQGGNVSEWNEAVVYGSGRGLRGGSFYVYPGSLRAAARGSYAPTSAYGYIGFRVATFADCNGNGIPDECDLDCGATTALGGGSCSDLYPAPACGQSDDDNGDGIPDECGACCGSFGVVGCLQLVQNLCLDSNGVYLEDGTVCDGTACPIPTVSEWGLVTMGLLVLAAGTVVLARRRAIAVR